MEISRVVYCDHLKERLVMRQIDESLPRLIIEQPERVFYDTATGYWISVAMVPYLAVDHLMMAAYEMEGTLATAVTIHPLEERDIELKVRSGRWQP